MPRNKGVFWLEAAFNQVFKAGRNSIAGKASGSCYALFINQDGFSVTWCPAFMSKAIYESVDYFCVNSPDRAGKDGSNNFCPAIRQICSTEICFAVMCCSTGITLCPPDKSESVVCRCTGQDVLVRNQLVRMAFPVMIRLWFNPEWAPRLSIHPAVSSSTLLHQQ